MRWFHGACSGDRLTRRSGPRQALVDGASETCPGARPAVSWEDAKTRRMRPRDTHAEVDAHPRRWRVGTKPCATRPLADRELPTSLREDLGEVPEPWKDVFRRVQRCGRGAPQAALGRWRHGVTRRAGAWSGGRGRPHSQGGAHTASSGPPATAGCTAHKAKGPCGIHPRAHPSETWESRLGSGWPAAGCRCTPVPCAPRRGILAAA